MSESVKLGANLTFEEREADPIGSGGLHFAGRSGKSHDMRVLVEACVIWIDIDDDHLYSVRLHAGRESDRSYCSPITNKEVLEDLCQF